MWFELRLNERYTLVGDYIDGRLKGVTLQKLPRPAEAGPQSKER